MKNNGGPAFPVEGFEKDEGMSLRDYFAGQALIGIVAHNNGLGGIWEKAAEHAYRAADAMIEARDEN